MTEFKPQISDEAVEKKTGKVWEDWYRQLDDAGAKDWSHKEIVAYLAEQHHLEPWWQQMVTVTYEQARGLRDQHEMPSGYQISKSKTINAPVGTLYNAWVAPEVRSQWLAVPDFTIRTANQDKSLRITWVDGETSLDVQFYQKAPEKTQVVVQHSKLPTPDSAEEMKSYWAEALHRLEGSVQGL